MDNSNPFDNNNTQSQPPAVPDQNQNTPLQNQDSPAPTGIFTEGLAPAQPAPISTPTPDKHSKKPLIITIVLILVIALGVGGFFLVRNLTNNSTKTIAEFEKIVTGIGYTKAPNSELTYSGSDGEYTTYIKGTTTTVDGLTMFFVVPSKDNLKQLIEKEASSDIKEALFNFDWSKDYNKSSECNTNAKQVNICMSFVQKDNTLLCVFYHSNSPDETQAEIEKVINAMGY